MIDDTPPVCIEYRVRDGKSFILDAAYQADATAIDVSWLGAVFDLESLVSTFEIVVEDADTGDVLAGPINVGRVSSAYIQNLQLSHNQRVRSIVRATNRAGVSTDCASNGVVVDLTPPQAPDTPGGPVWDGNTALHGYEGEDLEYLSSTKSAFMSWASFSDPESRINNYWVWVEDMTGGALTAKSWVHPQLSQWVLSLPTLDHGDQYRVVVEAENGAGATTLRRSDGIEVDTTPPVFDDDTVFEILGDLGLEDNIIADEGATIMLRVSASDEESGIKRCRFALGTYPGGSDVSGVLTMESTDLHTDLKTVETRSRGGEEVCTVDGKCENVPVQRHDVVTSVAYPMALNEGVPLLNGFTFYAWAVCINNANKFVREALPRAFMVDSQPPGAGLVFDGLPQRLEEDFSASDELLAGNWRWWRDQESGIRFYEVSVGTHPGSNNTRGWSNVGLANSTIFSFLDEKLAHGTTYYVNVRAFDNAGHSVMASSDGVTIDLTPAELGLVEHGLWSGDASRYTNRDDLVLMRWSEVTDAESGVFEFEYALLTTPVLDDTGNPDITPFVAIGLGNQAAVTNVELQHGSVYYGAVRATNGVGLTSISYSRGLLVDLTYPECSARDGSRGEADMEFSTEGVPRVYVTCTDLESGHSRVRWGLGTIRGWDNALALQDAPFVGLPVPAHMDSLFNSTGDFHKSPTRIIDAELSSLSLNLLDGVKYYGLVYAANGAGSFVWETTDGQVHDRSPPAMVFGPRDVVAVDGAVDLQFTVNTTHWGCRFQVNDPHTGTGNVTVSLMLGETVLDAVDVTPTTTRVIRPVPEQYAPLAIGVTVHTRITATNLVGLVATYDSDGWVPDNTPPVFVEGPSDGITAGVDATYQGRPGSVAACWNAMDGESQVDYFEMSASQVSQSGSEVVMDWLRVPRALSEVSGVRASLPFVNGTTCTWTSGFDVEQGATYVVRVRAVNSLGLSSEAETSGVTVDWTPPVIGTIFLGDAAGDGVHSDSQVSSSSIVVAWTNVTDSVSPVASVSMALGSFPGSADIVARSSVANVTAAAAGSSFVFANLSLTDGASYYVTMWGTNAAGLEARRISMPIKIDSSAPQFVELPYSPFEPVYIFPSAFTEQGGYPLEVADSSVVVPISSFFDVHSGLSTITVSLFELDEDPALVLGAEAGDLVSGDVVNQTALVVDQQTDFEGGVMFVSLDGVTLTNATFVWASVTATNGVGISTTVLSRAVFIITETLQAGLVFDGQDGSDISFQFSTNSYSATWIGFTDPRSDIWYTAAVGSLPGLADIVGWTPVGTSTELHVTQGFSVEPGTVVYATVVANNDIGVAVNASSDGVVLGATPPSIDAVLFAGTEPSDDTSVQYLDNTPVVLTWNVSDGQGVRECTASIYGDAARTALLMSASVQSIDGVASAELQAPVAGEAMYARVSCVNIRNQTTVVDGATWAIVETTPPAAGSVFDGAPGVELTEWSDHTTWAAAHWHGFRDLDSHIVSCTACLGTPSDACSEAQVDDIKSGELNATGLALEDGGWYQWTVTCYNGAGMSVDARSAGFMIDVAPPVQSDVVVADIASATTSDVDAALEDADITHDTSTLAVAWEGFVDMGVGMDHYLVFLGTAASLDDVAVSSQVPYGESMFTFTNLTSVSAGGFVYATVRGVDKFGRYSEASSDGIAMDSTPPVVGRVVDTTMSSNASFHDIDMLSSSTLVASWEPSHDAESGVKEYLVKVLDVTSSNDTVVLDWSSVNMSTSFSHSSLPLLHAHAYVIVVRSINWAGLHADARSDGVVLDLTPPVAGVVMDGRGGVGLDLTDVVGVVAASWAGFHDPESSISHYEWCVGTAPGRSDVVACHDVGMRLESEVVFNWNATEDSDALHLSALLAPLGRTFRDLVLADESSVDVTGRIVPSFVALLDETNTVMPTYFSTVTAVSEIGRRTTVYSDGVKVDIQPPMSGWVVDGAVAADGDIDVQASLTTLGVNWFGFAEFQTSLTHYTVEVGTAAGSNDLGYSVVVDPDQSSVVIANLNLTNGATYFVTVSAHDETGLVSSNTTNGVLVDATPPMAVFVSDADPTVGSTSQPVRSIADNTSVVISWQFEDPESGVAGYKVRLCAPLLPETACPLDWTPVGASTERVEIIAPPLLPGVRYVAEVDAMSTSGVSAVARSAGFLIDDSPPTEGSVSIVDPSLLSSALLEAVSSGALAPSLPAVEMQGGWETVAAQWSGFADPESLVTGFSVCVGTFPEGDDIAPCHDVGMVFGAVINTSAASAYAGRDTNAGSGSVANNTFVFVTVHARNGANLTASAVSGPLQVDATPPVAGVVLDGTSGDDEAYTTDAGVICVVAEGFYDLESFVHHWEVCVGLQSGECGVSAFTVVAPEGDLGNETDAAEGREVLCLRSLSLTHDVRVFVGVRAINSVGHGTGVWSDGVDVVLEDPAAGTVVDAGVQADGSLALSMDDVDSYATRMTIGAKWHSFGVGHSAPIVSYAVAVCGEASGCNNDDNALSFFADVGHRHNLTLGAQGLVDGETYAWHVKAVDAAGRSVVAVSDGFIIDSSPPRAGNITILSYGAVQARLWGRGIDAGAESLSEEEQLLLTSLVAEAREEGRSLWHASFAPMHIAWTGFGDPESGMQSYEVCIGTDPSLTTNVLPCTTVAMDGPHGYHLVSLAEVNATLLAELQAQADRASIAAAAGSETIGQSAEPVQVQAASLAVVTVRGCNSVGLCTPVIARPVPVDLTPPIAGAVSKIMLPSTGEANFTRDTNMWRAKWVPFVDPESNVAFYTAAVVDVESGAYALEPTYMGSERELVANMLELQHGREYATEVVAMNFAGEETTVRGGSVVCDTTPASGGYVYDIHFSGAEPVDMDFGDGRANVLAATWGDWEDEESGIHHYEWAFAAIDPRESTLVSAERPGETLRAVVQDFLDANAGALAIPERQYGLGSAQRMFEVDNGVLFSDWLSVGHATSGSRDDLIVTTGITYVALLKIVNNAGTERIVASDGIVFDRSEPCVGDVHAGHDPAVVPEYLTTEAELSAVWQAVLDPVHQQDAAFACRSSSYSVARLDAIAANQSSAGTNASATGADIVDVAVVPLSHVNWQLRRIVSPGNSSVASNYTNVTSAAQKNGEEDTSKLQAAGDEEPTSPVVTQTDNSTETEAKNTTIPDPISEPTSVVDMPFTQVGPRLATPWSGCCSSYNELNPLVHSEEWSWRPIHPRSKFGSSMTLSSGRFLGVGSEGSATVMDVLHPRSHEHVITAASFGASSTSAVSVSSSDQLFAFATPEAVLVTRPPAVIPHEFHSGAATGADDALRTLATLKAAEEPLASAVADFTPVSLLGSVAVSGKFVALTLSGVDSGGSSGNAVVVLVVHPVSDVVSVAGSLHSASGAFGASVALSRPTEDDTETAVLVVSAPSECLATPTTSSDPADYVQSCAGDTPTLSTAVVNASGLFSTPTAELPPAAAGSFGSVLGSSGKFVAVGDLQAASGAGQVTVYSTMASGHTTRLCSVDGPVTNGAMGFSVAVTDAASEGRAESRNADTALVLAGAPAANLAVVIRVNLTAHETGERGASVCQVVSGFRQSAAATGDDDDVAPLYGAGTGVSIGGGFVAFSSPFRSTWSADDSSGRVFGAAFCWPGDVRTSAVAEQANVPSVCLPCSADGTMSSGGVSTVCDSCGDRVCRDPNAGFWYTGVNATSNLINGQEYEVDVAVVSRSGHVNTQTTPRFRVDWTPPSVGEVRDIWIGDKQSDDCFFCEGDIDATTNASYLAVAWCCGWEDLESGITSFSVAFGTEPGSDDVMAWRDVGLAENFTLNDYQMTQGQWYYACVVAVNGAGLFSEPRCTNGLIYDATPPRMLYVNDGFLAGDDVDSQSMLNVALATFKAEDNETSVLEYFISFGTAPGLDDLLREESAANATIAGVMNRPFDREPEEGETLYANVRAINRVGLSSAVLSSDGVVLGKAEVTLDNTASSTIALDTQLMEPDDGTDDGDGDGAPAKEPEKTLAAVNFPAGAVGDGEDTTFVGGAVSEADIAAGLAVNASETDPPAQNLKFGDYSFTLKAKSKDGGFDEGYGFEKPIIISMLYSVTSVLDGKSAPEDWQPDLKLYDVATKAWISAKDSCPPDKRWDEIDHEARVYRVAICHLTQFGLFFQQRPVATLAPPAGSLTGPILSNTSAALQRLGGDHASLKAGVPVYIVRLARDAVTGVLQPQSLSLDASASYDPDGTVALYNWTATVFNASIRYAQTDITAEQSSVLTATGSTAALQASSSEVVEAAVLVIDNQEGTRSASLWFWFDEPPVAVLGSTATHPAPRPNGVWTPIMLHVDHDAPATSVVADGRSSWDQEGSALVATWSIVPSSARMRSTLATLNGATIGANPTAPLVGVLSGMVPGSEATVQLSVRSDDEASVSDVATMQVVVNAKPNLVLDGPRVVFFPANQFALSISSSSDLDGTIVRRNWTVTGVSPPDILDRVTVSNLGTGLVETVSVTGISEEAVFNITVTLEDNDGAVTSSGVVRVVVKAQSEARATGSNTSVVSSPAWDGMTSIPFDGSGSFDASGSITAYEWEVTRVVNAAGVEDAEAARVATKHLVGANTATPSLVGGYKAGDYTVTLAVHDSLNVRLTDSVLVRVLLVPSASSRADGLVSLLLPATSIDLDAMAGTSVHNNVTVVGYDWSLISVNLVTPAGGCAPTFSTTSSASSTTTLRNLCGAGEYKVRLRVRAVDKRDGRSFEVSGTTTVVVHGQPSPVITRDGAAVQSFLTAVGRSVVVNASASSDDRVITSYQWSATPTGVVTISNAAAVAPTLQAVGTGSCVVTLRIEDDLGVARTTSTSVVVMAMPLTAKIDGGDSSPLVFMSQPKWDATSSVVLSAADSVFVDGAVEAYSWIIQSTTDPMADPMTVSDRLAPGAGGHNATFYAELGKTFDYVVNVTVVSQSYRASAVRPVVVLGFVQAGPQVQPVSSELSQVSLSSSESRVHTSAVDVTWSWSVVGTPGGCSASVDAPSSATTSLPLTCGKGDYQVALRMSGRYSGDATVHSATATTRVHVHDPPVAVLRLSEPSQALMDSTPSDVIITTWLGNTVPLDVQGGASHDDSGAIASFQWSFTNTQTGSPAGVSQPAANDAVATFANPMDANSRVELRSAGRTTAVLRVTDAFGLATTATVKILVFESEADAVAYQTATTVVPLEPEEDDSFWKTFAIVASIVLVVFVCVGMWTWACKGREAGEDSTTLVTVDKVGDLMALEQGDDKEAGTFPVQQPSALATPALGPHESRQQLVGDPAAPGNQPGVFAMPSKPKFLVSQETTNLDHQVQMLTANAGAAVTEGDSGAGVGLSSSVPAPNAMFTPQPIVPVAPSTPSSAVLADAESVPSGAVAVPAAAPATAAPATAAPATAAPATDSVAEVGNVLAASQSAPPSDDLLTTRVPVPSRPSLQPVLRRQSLPLDTASSRAMVAGAKLESTVMP